MPAKLTPQERLRLIKRVTEGKEKVARVCREAGISRVLFYRWLKRYKQAPKPVLRELSPNERLAMIEKVKAGESVSSVCQDFGVSRVIFYRWKKRYDEAPEGQKLEALWDKKPRISKYYRQAPEKVEQAVLSVIIQYPELSTHKIVELLPQIGGKPILGNHGVQNVLRRHNLTTYQQRLAYSLALRHVPGIYDRFLHSLQSVLTTILALPARRRLLTVRFSAGFALGVFAGIVIFGAQGYLQMIGQAPVENKLGLVFASIALSAGSFFFLYSLKYYLTLALVLGFSRHVGGNGNGNGKGYTGGLQPNLDHIKLERKPFVSIHLPLYNEEKVVNRLLTACTSLDYENYEVVVVDDSTDETTKILEDWKNHPRVKIIHRSSRAGFKGGALREALRASSPKTEFVLVFDADFIPYPDTITQFLKYFQSIVGSLTYSDSKIACIQGYQWHVLNKSENWITRGVRSEYAGSYVVERSGTEVLGALKQIAGSVYMIRADLLRKYGWGTSITEDFELTLRLYHDGYKVIYTPYIQGPAECVATIKRLIRQRMRWAEGHSHNIRRRFAQILTSPKMTLTEKLEFLYLSPYYLQATLFLIGTLSWFISEAVFRARLPFWTSLWGWSLVLTNLFSLPLMNTVGLFLEESEERDYLGILAFVPISYLLVPFQAYASVKGFLEREEGPWFRTPKTGKITDIFTRGRFYRWISGILPGRVAPATSPITADISADQRRFGVNQYLALVSANQRFNNFQIRPKRLRWVSRMVLVILLCFSVSLFSLARNVSVVTATPTSNKILYFHDNDHSTITVSDQIIDGNADIACDTAQSAKHGKTITNYIIIEPDVANNNSPTGTACPATATGTGWIFETPFDTNGYLDGAFTFDFYTSDNASANVGYIKVCAYRVAISGSSITSSTPFFEITGTTDVWVGGALNSQVTASDPCGSGCTFTSSEKYLYLDFWINSNNGANSATAAISFGDEQCGSPYPRVTTGSFLIPEKALFFLATAPFIPMLVLWMKKRRTQ